jgi:hypothetical protein
VGGQDLSEAFSHPPDAWRPHEHGDQGGLHGPGHEQPDADGELQRGEEEVPGPRVGGDQVGGGVDDPGDGASWPAAIGEIISDTNSRPHIRGWYWSAASRIQNAPRAI